MYASPHDLSSAAAMAFSHRALSRISLLIRITDYANRHVVLPTVASGDSIHARSFSSSAVILAQFRKSQHSGIGSRCNQACRPMGDVVWQSAKCAILSSTEDDGTGKQLEHDAYELGQKKSVSTSYCRQSNHSCHKTGRHTATYVATHISGQALISCHHFRP